MAEIEVTVPSNPWKILSMVLVILLVVSVFFNIQNNAVTGAVVADDSDETIIDISADDDPFLGPEDAEIVVIEFSDFECPYCGAATGTHEYLISNFKSQDPSWEAPVPKLKELAEQGKIKFVFRDFPLSAHSNAQKAAEAAECAHEQGKFWEMHDKLFENQDALTLEDLKSYAEELELDTTEFNDCLDNDEMFSEVQSDLAEGVSYGITGTPTFFVNGIPVVGAHPFSTFQEIIGE